MEAYDAKQIRRGAVRYFIRTLIAPMLMACLYFLMAGNFDYPQAWFYYVLFFTTSLLINLRMLIKNPELLFHRNNMKKDAKGWDKILMPAAVLTGFHLQSVVMGLEARFIQPYTNIPLIILGTAIYLVSTFISTWAVFVNKHFEANVRIQKDRDHKVITSGPYAIVRHPGYLGFILYTFCTPLILGSWYGFINAILGSVFILIRTKKEDQTLHAELAGYSDYAGKTNYRIFPGIW